jgi:hypothetical protein
MSAGQDKLAAYKRYKSAQHLKKDTNTGQDELQEKKKDIEARQDKLAA